MDTASGYFYVYYSSRIVPKGGAGGNTDSLAHVARAPISGKLATGTWQKWYDGAWSQPGVGGLESNMVPVTSANANGYTPVANDYNPANTGTTDQQIAAGTLPPKSDLLTMNIAYDAYLGLYIGEPEVNDQATGAPQRFYVTDDLATQKWYLIGDTGSSYATGSWYRWFLDNVNKTSSTIIGKTFRSYCSTNCMNLGSEADDHHRLDRTRGLADRHLEDLPIGSGSGRVLAQVSGGSATTSVPAATGSALQSWSFKALGDGSFTITNAGTGRPWASTPAPPRAARGARSRPPRRSGRAAQPSGRSGSSSRTRPAPSASSTGTAVSCWPCPRTRPGSPRRPRCGTGRTPPATPSAGPAPRPSRP